MKYYGKSEGDITIEQHTKDVEESADIILNKYDSYFNDIEKKLIKLACRYHDYGKYNANFTKRMYDVKNIKIEENDINEALKVYKELNYDKCLYPHGYLSCAFIPKDICKQIRNENSGNFKALVNAIVYHHARKILPVDEEIDKIIKEDLQKRFPEEVNSRFKREIWYKNTSVINVPTDELWVRYAVIKGILNRADYYASGKRDFPLEIDGVFDNNSSFKNRIDSNYPLEIDGIYEDEYLGQRIKRVLIQKYNNLRDVQKYMYENKDNNIVVVASTGSGKTEGAFLWADDSKVFYTLPLQVSINAIYDRIVDKKEGSYGYPTEKTSILHSNAMSYMLKKHNDDKSENNNGGSGEDNYAENALKKYTMSKNFAYPITICTIDQLFTFVYKYLGSEILLATLKYSKLVIDEIQAYSPVLIAKLIYGLKLLSLAGGKFAIMTATMPPIIQDFMKANGIEYKFEKFILEKNRHKIAYYKNDFDYEKIISYSKDRKVLVICNTVARAQEVYDILDGKCDNIHLLHARFIKKHKQMLENAIMKFSNGNENGVWVATQIVEASLDIDFDVLFTEMCTADSLLQRMGRCYRKRDYCLEEANIFIYENKDIIDETNGRKHIRSGYGTVYEKELYDRSATLIQKYNNSLFTEQQKLDYIDEVYDTKALRNSDSNIYNEINDNIEKCKSIFQGEIDGKDAVKMFRDIESHMLIPNSIYESIVNDGTMEKIEIMLSNDSKLKKEKGKNELMEYVVTCSYTKNDKYSINEYLDKYDINRTMCIYEFEEDNLKGRGLTTEEEECMII